MESSKEIFNEQIFGYAQAIIEKAFGGFVFILPSAITWSAIMFFLVIIILIILTKKKFFKRDYKIWKLLVKLHYPVWIAVFVVMGFIIGTMNSAGLFAERILDEIGKPMIESSVPTLYESILDELSISSPNNNDTKITISSLTDQVLDTMAYVPNSDSKIQNLKTKSINWVRSGLGKWIITSTIHAMVTEAIQSAGKALHIDEKNLEFDKKSLINIDFSRTETLITKLVLASIYTQLNNLILAIKVNVYLMFFIFMLLLLLEPAIHYFWKKNILQKKSLQGFESDAKIPS